MTIAGCTRNPTLLTISTCAQNLVFLKAFAGDGLPGSLVGDDEGKGSEGGEEEDEQEHAGEVEPEEAENAAGDADEAGERDEEDEDADDDEWPLKESEAAAGGGGALGGQPYPGHQDRHRQQRREEIQERYELVAEPHGSMDMDRWTACLSTLSLSLSLSWANKALSLSLVGQYWP